MENVELIPAICPKCGAKLKLPSNLKKGHCMYCGTGVIISERKADVHYHLGERIGTIENYAKITIDALKRGDQAKAKEYWLKAKEIDIGKATEIFDKYKKEIALAYIELARAELENYKQIEPIRGVYGILINSAMISLSGTQIETALDNADSFYEDVESFYIRGQYIIELDKKYHLNPAKDRKELRQKAYQSFRKCIEIDPNYTPAIEALKRHGIICSSCKGTGKCLACHGEGKCAVCKGNGNCKRCNGNGKVKSFFGKVKICDSCKGSGTCTNCNGSGVCPNCKGEITCKVCGGRGV